MQPLGGNNQPLQMHRDDAAVLHDPTSARILIALRLKGHPFCLNWHCGKRLYSSSWHSGWTRNKHIDRNKHAPIHTHKVPVWVHVSVHPLTPDHMSSLVFTTTGAAPRVLVLRGRHRCLLWLCELMERPAQRLGQGNAAKSCGGGAQEEQKTVHLGGKIVGDASIEQPQN